MRRLNPLSVSSVAYCTVVANRSVSISLSILLCPRPVYSTVVTALGNPGLHVWIRFVFIFRRGSCDIIVFSSVFFPLSLFLIMIIFFFIELRL